jgi:hypothetical protein
MFNKVIAPAVTVASMLVSSGAQAEETCETLSFGADFTRALQSNPINFFTDSNHDDPAFVEFLTNEAVRNCLNQAGITHLFLERNKDRNDLFQRLQDAQISTDQFVSEYFGDFSSQDNFEIQKIEKLATLITALASSDIEAIAADDLATSSLSLMALLSFQQGAQMWSTLLPEEERQSFLNWMSHGHPVSEETKKNHLQVLSDNSDTDTFRNGQRMLDNASELTQKGEIEARLDDRPTFNHISGLIEEHDITKLAIMWGEGHFSDRPNAINNLFPAKNSNIFCLRSEFTQTPLPTNICDYVINVTDYTFTPVP